MKSAFEIARSHITYPVSKDPNALMKVLRDWLYYTEQLKLQAKPTHPAALCVKVYPRKPTTTFGLLSRDFSFHHHSSGEAANVHTKYIPLQLWTALLPWEVQRGLSMSELRLPETEKEMPSEETKKEKINTRQENQNQEDNDDDDPFGVVTSQPSNKNSVAHFPHTAVRGSGDPAPGMLFVMDASAADQGVSFWSGAILQSIDIAFISPVEPAATNIPSFRELRKRQVNASEGVAGGTNGYDVTRFFQDGELDSPTVTFAVQSYSHLDPFPHVGKSNENCGTRQHVAQPAEEEKEKWGFGSGASVRYVLETTRHLLRDSTMTALREYHQLRRGGSTVGTMEEEEVANVELSISLLLSDELKEELREKARLYTNYVVPLEENLSEHIRRQNKSSIVDSHINDAVKSDADKMEDNSLLCNSSDVISSRLSSSSLLLSSDADANAAATIRPSQPNGTRADRRLSRRSPMLADEDEGIPTYLAPSVIGKHEAPALQQAEEEQQQQVVSAKALARYPKTSPRMPNEPPIDYELFDLSLRLGLCQHDAIYYFYGRIMREWQKELQRLKGRATCGGGGGDNNNNSSINSSNNEISEDNVRRMLRLVRDPSLQVPGELSSCVEAVAQRRGITS
ncbi:hypothetical protein LSM04_004924 [Trypanosoma melophagium]|uniref:uncharacterized protein n=1 Tax=Trypanosoma melophagium TaxID=715481 RepID=UPI00351A7654|nr:hypothetical protein LSM04_004924 [Trypanosoma melophagium]